MRFLNALGDPGRPIAIGEPYVRRAAEVLSGNYEPTPAHTAVYLAEIHAALGDVTAALRALGRYRFPRDLHFQLHLRCSPTFAPMERDSTFRAMLVVPRPAPGQHC